MKSKEYKKPDLKVIDMAIARIKDCTNKYSCIALSDSCIDSGYGSEAYVRYWDQYEKYVRSKNKGRIPYWWNKDNTPEHRQVRIKALTGFKNACIAAGKKLQ